MTAVIRRNRVRRGMRILSLSGRRAATGRFLERVGFYDPKAPEGREALRVNVERVKHWEGKGARLSPTVVRLVKKFGKAQKAA